MTRTGRRTSADVAPAVVRYLKMTRFIPGGDCRGGGSGKGSLIVQNLTARKIMVNGRQPWVALASLCLLVAASGSSRATAHSFTAQQPTEPLDAVHAVKGSPAAPGRGQEQDRRIELSGAGGGTLRADSYRGDVVTFRLRGSGSVDDPVGVKGSFHVTHVQPDGTVLADFEGTMNCLMAGSDVAVVTGTITDGFAPTASGEAVVGRQIGLTVADRGRRDSIGWSWLVMGFSDASGCTSPAPFFPVTTGGFTVDAPRQTSPI